MKLNKQELLILICFLIIGLALRNFFLKDGALTFGFDQARDAYIAQSIFNGDLKLQGPSSSTLGIYHGVAYYYLIAPAYFLGQGNPIINFVWLTIINILTIFPIFLLGRILFSRLTGFLAVGIFTISFEAIQYSNWLSNPAPAIFSSAIFYLGVARYVFLKKDPLAVVLAAIGLGFSIQFQIFLAYLIAPLIICLIYYKVRPKLKDIILFGGVFLLTILTILISYLKFGLTFLSGIQGFVEGPSFKSGISFSQNLDLYLNQFTDYFYRGILPFNITIAGILGVVIVCFLLKYSLSHRQMSGKVTFLLIMLFSHSLLLPFGGQTTPYINVGLQTIIVTVVAFVLWRLLLYKKWLGMLLLSLIVITNLNTQFKYSYFGPIIFDVQNRLILRNQLAAIDYTYQASGGKNFTINTITSPLWINTVWSYLYEWYGKNKFGSVPSFHGKDQSGILGNLTRVTQKDEVYFLIIEPSQGIPEVFIKETIAQENYFSEVTEQKTFGEIIVQKRVLTKIFREGLFIK